MEIDFTLDIINCAMVFDIELDMIFETASYARISLDIGFDLLLEGYSNYGYALLPRVQSIGGEIPAGYGVGVVNLPALYSQGDGGFYVPPAPVAGFAMLSALSSSGFIETSSSGSADNVLTPQSKGGVAGFGEGSALLPILQSKGYEGAPGGYVDAMTYCYLGDGIVSTADQIIFINSVGEITDTISATRSAVVSFLNYLTATGIASVIAGFTVALQFSATEQSLTQAIVTSNGADLPGVDPHARVWVVNMETGASSQYDNYGFNSFLERDGQYYGLADDGIYLLEGSDDNGIPIPWFVDFGVTDCGLPGRKKILNFHVDTEDGSQMTLTIETESGVQTYPVEMSRRGATGWRVKIPYNVQGQAWEFLLQGTGPANLVGIEFDPIKLSKRL